MTNDNRPTKDERRVHNAVRDVFVPACILLAPLMKDRDGTLIISGFAMMHIVQGHFPELSGSEARIVITAVERLHRENRLQVLIEQ